MKPLTFMQRKLLKLQGENKADSLGSDFVPHRSRLQKEQDKAAQALKK